MEMRIPNFEGAACAGTDTEFFFKDGLRDPYEMKAYRQMCGGCPIQNECLSWGLHHEEHGMWGGLTVQEIRDLRKKRGIPLRSITTEMILGKMYSST